MREFILLFILMLHICILFCIMNIGGERMLNLTAEEIKARRDYHREWRKNHPDNIREAQLRYWQRKARQAERLQGKDSIKCNQTGTASA